MNVLNWTVAEVGVEMIWCDGDGVGMIQQYVLICLLVVASMFCAFCILLATFVDHIVWTLNSEGNVCIRVHPLVLIYSKLFSITYSSG